MYLPIFSQCLFLARTQEGFLNSWRLSALEITFCLDNIMDRLMPSTVDKLFTHFPQINWSYRLCRRGSINSRPLTSCLPSPPYRVSLVKSKTRAELTNGIKRKLFLFRKLARNVEIIPNGKYATTRHVKNEKQTPGLACSFWSTFLFPSMHFSLQIMHNDGRWDGACPNRTVSHQNSSIFHIVKQFPAQLMICTIAG